MSLLHRDLVLDFLLIVFRSSNKEQIEVFI